MKTVAWAIARLARNVAASIVIGAVASASLETSMLTSVTEFPVKERLSWIVADYWQNEQSGMGHEAFINGVYFTIWYAALERVVRGISALTSSPLYLARGARLVMAPWAWTICVCLDIAGLYLTHVQSEVGLALAEDDQETLLMGVLRMGKLQPTTDHQSFLASELPRPLADALWTATVEEVTYRTLLETDAVWFAASIPISILNYAFVGVTRRALVGLMQFGVVFLYRESMAHANAFHGMIQLMTDSHARGGPPRTTNAADQSDSIVPVPSAPLAPAWVDSGIIRRDTTHSLGPSSADTSLSHVPDTAADADTADAAGQPADSGDDQLSVDSIVSAANESGSVITAIADHPRLHPRSLAPAQNSSEALNAESLINILALVCETSSRLIEAETGAKLDIFRHPTYIAGALQQAERASSAPATSGRQSSQGCLLQLEAQPLGLGFSKASLRRFLEVRFAELEAVEYDIHRVFPGLPGSTRGADYAPRQDLNSRLADRLAQMMRGDESALDERDAEGYWPSPDMLRKTHTLVREHLGGWEWIEDVDPVFGMYVPIEDEAETSRLRDFLIKRAVVVAPGPADEADNDPLQRVPFISDPDSPDRT